MDNIIDMLSKGDLRQKGYSEKVVEIVLKDNSLFPILIGAIEHDDAGVRMRASDAVEKLTREKPELLSSYKDNLLKYASQANQQEVRWHLAQVLPRLELTERDRGLLFDIMSSYLNDNSRIVVTFSMQALADIAQQDASYLPKVVPIIKKLNKTGTPAMISRSRKLLKQLNID